MANQTLTPKKLAAIAAAVRAYLENQQQGASAAEEFGAAPSMSLWGVSARQEAIQFRTLLQRRGLRK